MESFWMYLAGGLGTLFTVAVAVAWWEHLERTDRQGPNFETPRPAVAQVDVDLDEPAGGDGDERRAVLAGAMGRMSQPLDLPLASERAKPAGWMDTRPVIMDSADLGRREVAEGAAHGSVETSAAP